MGNQLTFFADGPFHPNLLHIYRPSSSFDLTSLSNLFLQASQKSSKLCNFATDGDELMAQHHIERIIQEAIRGETTRFQFPPALNSFQRRLVHETAEEMGLWHESVSLGRGVTEGFVHKINPYHCSTNTFKCKCL